LALDDQEPERNRFAAGNRTHGTRMRVGRKKINDDEYNASKQRFRIVNSDRRSTMERVLMRNIMRLVVVGSLIAIAANIVVVFG